MTLAFFHRSVRRAAASEHAGWHRMMSCCAREWKWKNNFYWLGSKRKWIWEKHNGASEWDVDFDFFIKNLHFGFIIDIHCVRINSLETVFFDFLKRMFKWMKQCAVDKIHRMSCMSTVYKWAFLFLLFVFCFRKLDCDWPRGTKWNDQPTKPSHQPEMEHLNMHLDEVPNHI